MSNNIYDILKKMANLDTPKATLTESKKAKPDYIDIDKDGDKTESMKKAAKDKTKSGMAEAVAKVEQQLSEKYMGFKKTVAAVKKGGSAEDPEAVAAAIGRKKYGKEKFQKAAAKGKKLGEETEQFRTIKQGVKDFGMGAADLAQGLATMATGGKLKSIDQQMSDVQRREQRAVDRAAKEAGYEVGTKYHKQLVKTSPTYRDEYMSLAKDAPMDQLRDIQKQLQLKHDPMGGPVDESALQAYIGDRKYGKEGMDKLRKAGRAGASKEEMAKIRAQHDKMDEDAYHEDMLSPGQKKIASMAGDPDKIDAKDFAALRGQKKSKKTEGNRFTGKLDAARRKGLTQADLDGDGEMEPVREGFLSPEEKSRNPDYQAAKEKRQQQADFYKKQNTPPELQSSSSPEYQQWRADRDKQIQQKTRAELDQKQTQSNKAAAEREASRGPVGKAANYMSRLVFGQDLPEGKKSMQEGWEEMQKYLEKKRGPESKGGEGKKAGTRYGGSAQQDDSEDTDGEGQPTVKKKGRPKGTGGGAKFSFKKPKD